MDIVLERVKGEKRDALFRLLQYSLFEESLTDLNDMNDDALFDYPWFDAYFAEPQREALFIRQAESNRLLGFAMVREHEDGRHSIAEFLVIPKYRRRGVGSQAARACFALHDGLWEVKPAYGSEGAKLFWQQAIGQLGVQANWIDDRFEFVIRNKEAWGMDAMQAMLKRRSYRGKYASDSVPREHLQTIMEAGLAAPSGCNKQTTSLIAVDDPALMERLHAAITPSVGETAPAMICVLTKQIIAYRDRCFATQDYAAAIQNMLLAIEALGYASCWVEGHITDIDRIGRKMADILGVPEDLELVCFLPVGKAEEETKAPVKKPFSERAWFNGFGKE